MNSRSIPLYKKMDKRVRQQIKTDKTFARSRIKQGTNRTRFSWIAEWDVRLCSSLCQTTEAQNLNAFFMTLWEARKPCEAISKATICPALFDETLCRVLNERSFSPVAVCKFIEMNWRSATFECWVYHLELNNPLSACISCSNKSMKRGIWKLNLELNRMCDFVVYCFCLAFNIPLPVSTRKERYC